MSKEDKTKLFINVCIAITFIIIALN